MGRTIEKLAERTISKKCVFNNRFVTELCESAHIHYRNLRIVLSLDEFITVAEGFVASLDRWKKRGCPGTGTGQHIELCRKKVAVADDSDKILINLNENLYNKNEDGIFAEGAEFTDEKYVHLKIRDIRLELSIDDFRRLADAVQEANGRLENSSFHVALPQK